jgi:hypothetical protein
MKSLKPRLMVSAFVGIPNITPTTLYVIDV